MIPLPALAELAAGWDELVAAAADDEASMKSSWQATACSRAIIDAAATVAEAVMADAPTVDAALVYGLANGAWIAEDRWHAALGEQFADFLESQMGMQLDVLVPSCIAHRILNGGGS